MSNFNNFGLDPKILQALDDMGYKVPTPIQELTIPKVLEGVDVIASAQTGTGKTAAFMLPILHLLSQPDYRGNGGPQILILVPTRELAMQVAQESKKFSKYIPKLKTVCIYGGVPYPVQKKDLSSRYEILVATPGRLMDHMDQGRIDLSRIKLLVLDEADRMLDMGFIDDVEHISKSLPADRQTLMFSATIDKRILPVSRKLQKNAHEIKAELTALTKNNIEQRLYYVDNVNHKMQLLEHLLENIEIHQSIVFTSTIQQANDLADHLHEKGYLAEALHGDMNQRQRTRTISKLRSGQIKFLVATDVASRGIDIPSLSHVFNFDLPFQADDFTHRIGRTGRAGAKGTAITFTTYKEELRITKINKLMGEPIKLFTVEGMEAKPKGSSRPSMPRRSSSRPRFNDRERSEGSNTAPRFKGPSRDDKEYAPRFKGSTRGENDNASNFKGPARGDSEFAPRFKGPARAEREFAPRFKGPARGENDYAPRFKGPSQGQNDYAPRFKGPARGDNEYAPRFKGPAQGQNDYAPRFKGPARGENGYAPRFKGPQESIKPRNNTDFAKKGYRSAD